MYYKIKRGKLSIGVNNSKKTEEILKKRGIRYSSKIEGFKYIFYNGLTINRRPLNEKEREAILFILEIEGL